MMTLKGLKIFRDYNIVQLSKFHQLSKSAKFAQICTSLADFDNFNCCSMLYLHFFLSIISFPSIIGFSISIFKSHTFQFDVAKLKIMKEDFLTDFYSFSLLKII
ncbi:hypothetical protein BpHYR1_047939 [Brachionus plicatilis]|uniref:Uncharacterized protein n=1 Tax=Brachionus plicatilis TaxID=10195 RepID=A0A3M7S130_BRAPC|nr:hypothetical protein BpHYR1_047939 [Brachionus plicatilis]